MARWPGRGREAAAIDAALPGVGERRDALRGAGTSGAAPSARPAP